MRTIESKQRELDYANYRMRSASDGDYHELITEPIMLMHENEVRVVYDSVPFDTAKYKEAFTRIRYDENERTSGLKTVSRIFGFSPRNTLRKDFCSTTKMQDEHPEEHALIVELGQKLAKLYLNRAPDVYDEHKETTEGKIKDAWKIPGTPFTSGIINKNNPLKYHFDTGNFKKVFSCMIAFKNDCGGGHLSLPEYDIGLEIADNSVLLFDGQEILHGVTPFTLTSNEGYRYTAVYYSLRRMWDCLTVDDEIARIRSIKTGREQKRANQ